MLDREQETLPVSDYAITTAVLDLDEAERETGYHYRILDPIADDTEGAASELAHLWQQYRALDYWWPEEAEPLPEYLVTLTEIKAKTLYERLKQTLGSLRHAPHLPNAKVYEFVIDPRQSFGGWVMLHVNGRFHFICERGKIHSEEEAARRNIVLAVNSEFDVKGHRRRLIAARAKALKLSDDYPQFGGLCEQTLRYGTPQRRVYRSKRVDPYRKQTHAVPFRGGTTHTRDAGRHDAGPPTLPSATGAGHHTAHQKGRRDTR